MENNFAFGEDTLTSDLALGLASRKVTGSFNKKTISAIKKSQEQVQKIVAENQTVYGVNTGFGILATTKISEEDTRILQHKILQSHSVGVGEPVPEEIARLMLITKVHSLAKGFSGIQLATIERILWFLENDVIPVVPEQGSVGASGDLAPLAHLFLPLIGLGKCYFKNKIVDTDKIPSLKPIALGPKEGLALINGTQFILSYAIKAVQRMHNCLEAADIIGAMSLEALTGTKAPFDERLHELRPFAGSKLVAKRLASLLQGSA